MACQENCGEGTVTQARRRGVGGPPRGGAADVSAPVRGAGEGAKRSGPRGSKAEGAPGVVQAVQVGEADVAPSSAVRVLGVTGLHLQDDLRTTYLIFSEPTPKVSEPSTFFQNSANIRNMSEIFENMVYNVPASTGARRQLGGSTVAARTGLNKKLFSRRRWAGRAGPRT